MKSILALFGYLYIIGGPISIILINANTLPSGALYVVISVGLVFYTAKLYYLNNCTLFELNGRTLIFDLLYYAYYVLLASIVWYIFYILIKHALPEPYYSRAFPKSVDFFNWARQWVFIAALIALSTDVSDGINYEVAAFEFTNKVAIMEVLRVLIALLWTCIFPTLAFIFISFTAFNTMPEHVKRWLSRWLSGGFKRDVDLLKQHIQNNKSNGLPRVKLSYFIKDVILIPVEFGLRYQILPLSIIMLLMYIVGENFFFFLQPTPPSS